MDSDQSAPTSMADALATYAADKAAGRVVDNGFGPQFSDDAPAAPRPANAILSREDTLDELVAKYGVAGAIERAHARLDAERAASSTSMSAPVDPFGGEASQAALDEAARSQVPADPSGYDLPSRDSNDFPLELHQMQEAQTVAHALAMTPGEFKRAVFEGQNLARLTGGKPLDIDTFHASGIQTEIELQQRHGDAWKDIAANAMRAVEKANSSGHLELGRTLNDLCVLSPDFTEMLAGVARRYTAQGTR